MRTFWICLIIIVGTYTSYSQDADIRIGELMNNSDWFTLNEEYPVLKDDIQWKPLDEMAKVLLAYYFNRHEEALENINTLLTNHQDEIGYPNIYNFLSMAANIHGQQGRYAQCSDIASGFISQLNAQGVYEGYESMQKIYDVYNRLRDVPAPELIREEKDIEIPFTLKQEKRGFHMYVPVTVNGKEHQFIFDTGAAGTYFKQSFAENTGIKVLNDSILINRGTLGESYGMTGLLEEMSMASGDMVIKNIITIIARRNEMVDTAFTGEAVLGLDFMMRTGEMQILPIEKKIVFPVKKTPKPESGSNLMLMGNLWLKAYSGDERLIFWFDTGNVQSEMYANYYARHKDNIESQGTKEIVTMGGHGFIQDFEVFRLQELPLRIGGTDIKLKNTIVVTDPEMAPQELDGNLGMDFFMSCSKVTINFEDMFVKIEN